MFKSNRKKLVNLLLERYSKDYLNNTVVLMKGPYEKNIYDTDIEYDQRAESNFYYIFGCEYPDIYGLIHIDSLKSVLLIPKKSETELIFTYPYNKNELISELGVDDVILKNDLNDYLLVNNISKILISENDDRGRPAISAKDLITNNNINIEVCNRYLYSSINMLRTIKSDEEIEKMKVASMASSLGHIEVMKNVKPGMREYQLSALFLAKCVENNCYKLAYESISATGANASILHYIDGNSEIANNDLILIDMGCKYEHYCSDISSTFPASGKFTDKQKIIYNIVLKMHDECANMLKVGANIRDIQTYGFKILVEELFNLNIITKGTVEELMEKKIYSVFMQHALGHYIGIRVHDVGLPIEKDFVCEGEYNETEFKKKQVYKSIFGEKELLENMITTIEPGIYFNKLILDIYFEKEEIKDYLNKELIKEYQKEVGGVRIEDIYIIKKEGSEKITNVPRTVEEIEALMAN